MIEQKVKLDFENERAQEQLNLFEAPEVEETKALSSLSMKLNVTSVQLIGMVTQGSKKCDAVYIGYEADATAHLLETDDKRSE